MWNAERAKQRLDAIGRTRKWLAKECGIKQTSLNNILRGREPGKPVLFLMARALETSVEWLTDDESDAIPERAKRAATG